MAHVVTRASASIAPEALADLLWNTDPKLNSFMFQRREVLLDILRCEWPENRGLLCHAQAFTVLEGDTVLGLLVGHTADEYGPNFDAAQELQSRRLSPQDATHLNQALHWMDRLFPTPREGAYYVLELSTAVTAQGAGIASLLLDAAENCAKSEGCTHIALDVAADNAAVDFYRHKGFGVDIETRVPYLADTCGIGLHLHMTRPIKVPS